MGAAVLWLWGRQMRNYVEEQTRGVRTKAAEGARAVGEKAETVLEREDAGRAGGEALRRADEFVQDTKEHVNEALRAGQDAIRPAPAARKDEQERG